MTWYEWLLIGYALVAVAYGLRLAKVYFQSFEGQIRNGLIVTTSLIAGLTWPFGIFWHGFKEMTIAVLPIKEAPEPVVIRQTDEIEGGMPIQPIINPATQGVVVKQ